MQINFILCRRPHVRFAPDLDSPPGKAERGTTMVEFALTLGIFSLILFGLIGMAVVFFGWLTVTSAARDGARYVVGNPTVTDTQVRQYICSTTIMLGGSQQACLNQISAGTLDITIAPSKPNAGGLNKISGSSVNVNVRFRVPVPTLRASFLGTGGITFLGPIWVQSTSVMRVE